MIHDPARLKPSLDLEDIIWDEQEVMPNGRPYCHGKVDNLETFLIYEPSLLEWFYYLKLPAQRGEEIMLGPREAGYSLVEAKELAAIDVRSRFWEQA